jgi:hypothetical protein
MVVHWPTMNNTHPWNDLGRPLRPDRPEWLRGVQGEAKGGANAANFREHAANCMGCDPFVDWLLALHEQALSAGGYRGWCIDGDFWGSGAYYHTTVPVTCTAENHRHRAPDSNYACQRALDRLIGEVRRTHPDEYIVTCRPPCDLGVWSNRNVDACFTLIETGSGDSNVAAGDEIRTASRIRVQHQFFPHTLDWPLLFPSFGDPNKKPAWPRGHIDYILLSALSSSTNLLFYLPARDGIPKDDQAEIRRWLDWGRKNEALLKVRHDLFDWPGPDRVDGSAHIVDDHGLVFLFNPSKEARTGKFTLNEEGIGLAEKAGPFVLSQEYPANDKSVTLKYGETAQWEVPAESVVVVKLEPKP